MHNYSELLSAGMFDTIDVSVSQNVNLRLILVSTLLKQQEANLSGPISNCSGAISNSSVWKRIYHVILPSMHVTDEKLWGKKKLTTQWWYENKSMNTYLRGSFLVGNIKLFG